MITYDVVPGVDMVTHGFTNCFVVRDPVGVTLVDAAFPRTWHQVEECLRVRNRGVGDVRGLVITHGHFDHLGFAAQLQRQGVRVWAHRADEHILAHPYRYRPQRPRLLYPLAYPRALPVLTAMTAAGALRVPGLVADHWVDGQTTLDLPGRPVVVPTPGHTNGECVVHLPDHRAVLTGDALVTLDPYTGFRGPRVIARAATHDAATALTSIGVLADLAADVVLPGHGRPWRQGTAAAVRAAQAAGAR